MRQWLLGNAPWLTIAAWAATLGSVFLVDADHIRDYGSLWLMLTMIVSLYFLLGYTRFSRLTGPTGYISPEGLWLLSESMMFLVLTTYLLGFRLFNEAPALITDQLFVQYLVGAMIFVTVFYLQGAVAVLWTVRQVNTRRRLARERSKSPPGG